jgi:arylsulfatase A-like enzyme
MADPKDMTPIIRSDDYAIARIVAAYKQLGIFDKTLFVITADHGMASNRHIVPIHPMYRTVAHVAPSLDEEFRITVGSVWLRDPHQAPAVAAAMTGQHVPDIEGALYKVSGPNGLSYAPDAWTAKHISKSLLTAYLDLADTEASSAGADVIFPYAEDTTGLVVKGRKLWGNHGGFSWGVQHIPLILFGPGVHPGVSSFPAKLVDIAPTIETLLQLPVPTAVDGVVLADALANPSSAEKEAQRAVLKARMADVNALRNHSAAQSH